MSIIRIDIGGRSFFVTDDHDWQDVSGEHVRYYQFTDGRIVIDQPALLAVSQSGGHRIITADGLFVYVPPEWLALVAQPRAGHPHCSF